MRAEATRSERAPGIWSSVLRGLRLPLAEQNIDFLALLEARGIAERDLERAHRKIPLTKYLRFMEQAAVVANDPLLGIRLARSCGPETLGAVGFLFLSSRTLSEALSDFCYYVNLLQDTTDFRFVHDRRTMAFHYNLYGVPDFDCRQDVEFSMALTTRLIRMFGGPEVDITAITLRHSPSAPVTAYERLLGTKVRIDQESNSVELPASAARIRSHALDSNLSGILKEFLDAELARRGRAHSFLDQVRHVLLGNRIAPPVTSSKVAKHLNISQATLYRKLKAEGFTYGQLLQEVNFEIARNYLANSALPITQVAYIVGFAESASFTQAFKRWSNGTTPSEFRRQAATSRTRHPEFRSAAQSTRYRQ